MKRRLAIWVCAALLAGGGCAGGPASGAAGGAESAAGGAAPAKRAAAASTAPRGGDEGEESGGGGRGGSAEAARVQRGYGDQLILDDAETWTVEWGDTLSHLSKIYYDNGLYFPLIALASEVVFDVDLIYPGQALIFPDLGRNLSDKGARAMMKAYFAEVAEVYEARNRGGYAASLRALAAEW